VAPTLGGFLVVSLLVIVTPGQDTALTIRNSLLDGRRGGLLTALGVFAGQATWTVATSAGVAALLAASERLFLALKLAGAAYLVYLGARTTFEALRSRQRPAASGARRSSAPFRQGLLSNLGNPKMGVFFTSLLPQFAGRGHGTFWSLLALGLVFCCLTLGWLSAYAFVVARAGDVLRRPGVRRVLDAVTGVVLVGLGIRVATEPR
jgi:threonine/homoserine/homoserine lactone efflux protein